MHQALEFLAKNGPWVMFLVLFSEQAGLPLPASPFLLVAGALAREEKLAGWPALAAAIGGSMLADGLWFYIGRRVGHRAIKFLCRVSQEPDSCVRHTQDLTARYGLGGLIFGKFIPGISTLLPPLAGYSGMNLKRFLMADLASSLAYCGGLMALGFACSSQLEKVLAALGELGNGALRVLVLVLAAWLGFKILQRQRQLRQLRMPRISPEELYQQLQSTPRPLIFDLRSRADLAVEPWLLPGAVTVELDQIQARQTEFPADAEIITYCACPNEATSAKASLLLKKHGVSRTRPLLGGLDAWRERKFPVVPYEDAQPHPLTAKEVVLEGEER